MPDDKPPTFNGGLLTALQASGPHAFGAVLLLILWQVIVKPQMESYKLNYDALNESIMSMQRVQAEQLEASRVNNDTARLLKDTSVELKRILDQRANFP